MTLQLSQLPLLSRSMHDRAAHQRGNATWLTAAWREARIIIVSESTVEVDDSKPLGARLLFVNSDELDVPFQDAERVFLGVADDVPYFAILAKELPLHSGSTGRWSDLADVGQVLDSLESGLATAAVGLSHWHRANRQCPRCGTSTEITHAGWARDCPKEGVRHWPRSDPAVIVLIHDGADRCVLSRHSDWPTGRYSLLAGFVEPGETPEAAVVREVGEEVGIGVSDICYVASQPWPFPSSLMLGFIAQTPDTILRPDYTELEDAQWFSRQDIRQSRGITLLPRPTSIAHRMITDWIGLD